ncbi:hypothetical protein [Aureliella helgolandensis]|nr:hypothetical protein [Aureliella helgolandensis]
MFDIWRGPAPAVVKSQVDLIFRPGQAIAAAKILPNQSHATQFEAIAFRSSTGAHTYADTYRAAIGTVLALTYGGVSYGNVLVADVDVLEIANIIAATGVHPDGTPYTHSPAARITSRWAIVRLS